MVSIIIPVLNDEAAGTVKVTEVEVLESTLTAASTNIFLEHEIIVVLNGLKSKLLVKFIQSTGLSDLKVILSHNVGVARAWNIGAHAARGEFLCFVNADVVLGKGAIESMIELLKQDSTIGNVGPKGAIYSVDENEVRHVRYVDSDGVVECDAVSGFLFATPRHVFDKVGGFDDQLTPASCEELDYSFAVKKAGFRCVVMPKLSYNHEWGVSAAKPETKVKFYDELEEIGVIHARNSNYLRKKWGVTKLRPRSQHAEIPYGDSYFGERDYKSIMLQDRVINGIYHKPLVRTLADILEGTGLIRKGGSVLDIGCAYGYVVEELVNRGYDAYGIDLSPECVAASPVPERLQVGNAVEMNIDRRFDLVLLANLFEHLSAADSEALIYKLSKISPNLFTIINKGTHDPTHINLRSNYEWIKTFQKYGYKFDPVVTRRARKYYASTTALAENWQKDTLVFTRSAQGQNGLLVWLQEDVFIGEVKFLIAQTMKKMVPKEFWNLTARMPI
jgi:GT2 family glycosyltransferase/SAM-dependent methyltransferase